MINFTKDFDEDTEAIIRKSLEVKRPSLLQAADCILFYNISPFIDPDFADIEDAIDIASNISFAALLAVEEAYLAGVKYSNKCIEEELIALEKEEK